MMDVARTAGVAASTVSHVVNNTRFVHPDTRAAVEAAIAAIGYIPNTIARSLARSRTGTVGLAISLESNPYFVALVHEIVAECAKRDLLVLLSDTGEDPDRELAVVRTFHRRRVDAVLLAPVGLGPGQRTLSYLSEAKLPTVLVDRLIAPTFNQVGVDNRAGIALLFAHLRALGHTRIGMIGGQPGIATTIERIDAFRILAREAGLADVAAAEPLLSANVATACEAALALLASPDRPSAVIAGNNQSMIGLMQAVRRLGLSVPADLAVAGFDDFEWADCFHPRLTVVSQPVHEIGQRALFLLDGALKDGPAMPRTIQLQPELVVRESCGTPSPGRPSRKLARSARSR